MTFAYLRAKRDKLLKVIIRDIEKDKNAQSIILDKDTYNLFLCAGDILNNKLFDREIKVLNTSKTLIYVI